MTESNGSNFYVRLQFFIFYYFVEFLNPLS